MFRNTISIFKDYSLNCRQELFDDTSASPADSPQMACGSPVEGVARITIISYAQAFRAIKTCLEKVLTILHPIIERQLAQEFCTLKN